MVVVDGRFDRREGKVRLKWAGRVEGGVVSHVEVVQGEEMRVGIGMSVRKIVGQASLIQRVVDETSVASLWIIWNPQVRRRMDLWREFGRAFTRLLAFPN